MLALPVRTHGGLLTIDDDADPGRVYVALARPRVARRADGTHRLRLVRWAMSDGSATPAVGGRLTLDVEIAPSPAEIAAAGLAPRTVLPMPWLNGTVTLEGPQFDALAAEASLAIGTGASVAVDLSAAAAAALAPLLRSDIVSPLQVTWLGHVLVRLPPVEVIATADVDEIRRRMDITHGDRQIIISRSIINANARIEIRGAGNAALEQALRDWVLDELTTRFTEGRSLTIRAAAADVVRWPIQLAATIDDLIAPSSRHSLVETVVLDDSTLGRVPAIEVRVLGDFSGPLERVDLRLAAIAGPRSAEIACTDNEPKAVSLGTLNFRWGHRVKVKGRPPDEWSSWQEVYGSSSLLVPVSIPAALSVEVLAAGLDFTNRWTSVRVILTHHLPDASPVSHAVELTAAHTSETWTRTLDGRRGALKARIMFTSRHGQVIEQTIDDVAGSQVIVSDPLDNHRVRASLVPAGTGWRDVAIAMVDLRYVDGAHSVDETVELRSLNDFVEWEAPARPDGPQAIQWRLHASFTDGRFRSSAWQSTSSGVLVVRLEGTPNREVQLLPIYFDPAVTQRGTLRLRAGSQIATVVITDRAARRVILGPGPFVWTLAWTAADGTQLAESPAQAGEDVIVVPRFVAD